MNNDINLPDPEETVIDPSIKPTDAKIGNEGKLVLIIIAVVCLVICLCAVLCIGTGVFSIRNLVKENAQVKTIVDTFMQDMVANDIDSAYALFSPRSQSQTSEDDLRNMRSGSNAALFQGYDEITIHGLNIEMANSTDSNAPQGMIANVSGLIQYKNGKIGQFEAVLEKVDKEWMLYSIDLWQGASDNNFDEVTVYLFQTQKSPSVS